MPCEKYEVFEIAKWALEAEDFYGYLSNQYRSTII